MKRKAKKKKKKKDPENRDDRIIRQEYSIHS